MRRWLGPLLTLVILALVGIIGFLLIDNFTETSAEADEDPAPTRTFGTATVERMDLVSTETLEGILRYAQPGTLIASGAGTVTALPDSGSILRRGDVAFELNGLPVVLLQGDRPAWRVLSEDVDEGPDIEQLEANLVALGHATDDLTVDRTFDEETTTAIEVWQEALGLEETGSVAPGNLVFIPGPIRVGELLTDVGSVVAAGTPVYRTSAQDREVLVLLDANDQDLIATGDVVSVELPDDVVLPGTVREVSRVVISDGEGPEARRVVEVFIDLDGDTGEIDEAPVDVDVVSSEAQDVLAVPVEALLALAEGGYALERPDGELVSVELGKFADGMVEVIGNVAEGDTVIVPK